MNKEIKNMKIELINEERAYLLIAIENMLEETKEECEKYLKKGLDTEHYKNKIIMLQELHAKLWNF